MKPVTLFSTVALLTLTVSFAYSGIHNGYGGGHHGKGLHHDSRSCDGQHGQGFIDDNNDGVCDYFNLNSELSDQNTRPCYGKKHMKIKEYCRRWKDKDVVKKEYDNSVSTETTKEN